MSNEKHLVLHSGGLDSTVVLEQVRKIAKDEDIYTINFGYGQRHVHERVVSERYLDIHTNIPEDNKLNIELNKIFYSSGKVSALIGLPSFIPELQIPKNRDESKMTEDIPVTYVPGRNIVFLSIAAAIAESLGIVNVWGSMNAVDYTGYPDCRPEFINIFNTALNIGMKNSVTIETPLINLNKAEIIDLGKTCVHFEDTHSCYDPLYDGYTYLHCGECDSCIIRKNGFVKANVPDPTKYLK